MAGLQYNFFPTDFFYPRPQPVGTNGTQKIALRPQYCFFPTDFFYPRPQSLRLDTNQKVALPTCSIPVPSHKKKPGAEQG